jgi:hypothetical protein
VSCARWQAYNDKSLEIGNLLMLGEIPSQVLLPVLALILERMFELIWIKAPLMGYLSFHHSDRSAG